MWHGTFLFALVVVFAVMDAFISSVTPQLAKHLGQLSEMLSSFEVQGVLKG